MSILPACAVFVLGLLNLWQNIGFVTRIEIGDGWLTWTRQTAFGTTTRRWRADTITAVRARSLCPGVDQIWDSDTATAARLRKVFPGMHLLKISRRGGFPLLAFGDCYRGELHWAADALRAALGLTR